jgi:uncharacterized repeat protein (TIGR03803 family)
MDRRMNKGSLTRFAVVLALASPPIWGASAQVTVIHNFATTPGDGELPASALTLGPDGNFYGTSQGGGSFLGGTVFRITPSGTETVLYSFGSIPGDGSSPLAGLVQASDGLFYGTTRRGGATNSGTIFRISALGVYEKLYAFGAAPDGLDPQGDLIEAADGYLYGTTVWGGPYQFSDGFEGTLYRISKAGAYSQLYTFGDAASDGQWPFAGLSVGSDGALYGTTFKSGPRGQPALINSGGTFFKFASGTGISTLHNFHSPATCGGDGAAPRAALTLGSDGILYGVTEDGGRFGRGTIFAIDADGRATVLYSFGSIPGDGRQPSGKLLRLANGTLLGTTTTGGAHEAPDNGGGTIFMLSPDGTYTLLHSFGGTPTAGQYLNGGLAQGPDGNYYGTTINGGSTADRSNGNVGAGTVYKMVINNNGTASTFNAVPVPQYGCSEGGSGGGGIDFACLLGLGFAALGRRRRRSS